MKISEIGRLKIKIMACFTVALMIVSAILVLLIYKTYSITLLRYEPGWLMPFVLMYIAQFPIILGGQVGGKVLLSKICGFSLVYGTYFYFVVYKLIHPINGFPSGLLVSGTLMLVLMPVVYSIGWGIGYMIFILYPKAEMTQPEKAENYDKTRKSKNS